MVNLAVFEVSWGSETEYVAIFSHRHLYSASLHYLMSIRAVDSVCPQAILVMIGRCSLPGQCASQNITSINCSSTLCCLELNWEHAGEGFRSLRFMFFRNTHVKLKNCRFCKKWPLISRIWVKYWPMIKKAEPIESTRRGQSTVFFLLSSTMLSFETLMGRTPPPPFQWRRRRNTENGWGLMSYVAPKGNKKSPAQLMLSHIFAGLSGMKRYHECERLIE